MLVANFGFFNSECHCLRVNAFGGRALFVNVFVGRAFAIQLIAQPGSDTGRDGGGTSAFVPVFMGDRTRFFLGFGIRQWADVTPLMSDNYS